MRCYKHSEREGFNTCSECGEWICDECTVELNGRLLCKNCVAALAGRGHGKPAAKPPERETYTRAHKQGSGLWLFLLSFLPGLGYMYLGLIKRGLFVMAAFFLDIYLLSELGVVMFAFAIPIILFASFFDGFRILKLKNSGEIVTDNVDDFVGFAKKHKAKIIGFIGLAFVWSFATRIIDLFRYPMSAHDFFGLDSVCVFVLVLLVGLLMLLKSGRRRRRVSDKLHEEAKENSNDVIDKR